MPVRFSSFLIMVGLCWLLCFLFVISLLVSSSTNIRSIPFVVFGANCWKETKVNKQNTYHYNNEAAAPPPVTGLFSRKFKK